MTDFVYNANEIRDRPTIFFFFPLFPFRFVIRIPFGKQINAHATQNPFETYETKRFFLLLFKELKTIEYRIFGFRFRFEFEIETLYAQVFDNDSRTNAHRFLLLLRSSISK